MRFGYCIADKQWWREFAKGQWMKCQKAEVPAEIVESKWLCFGPL
jgi:hypothetical protein